MLLTCLKDIDKSPCFCVWNLHIVRPCFALPMLLQFCWGNTGAKPTHGFLLGELVCSLPVFLVKGICWPQTFWCVVAFVREMLWQGTLQFRSTQSNQHEMDGLAERAEHKAHPVLFFPVHACLGGYVAGDAKVPGSLIFLNKSQSIADPSQYNWSKIPDFLYPHADITIYL